MARRPPRLLGLQAHEARVAGRPAALPSCGTAQSMPEANREESIEGIQAAMVAGQFMSCRRPCVKEVMALASIIP